MSAVVFQIYQKPLREILLYMALGIALWAILNFLMEQNARAKKMTRWLNMALFFACLSAIFYITILKRTESETDLILRPFQSFAEARTQPELYRSMLMNVFLFFPIGLFMPYSLPENVQHKVSFTIFFAAVFSIVIEANQYYFGLGRCETDDVIMNVLGAAAGSFSYVLYKKLGKLQIRGFFASF